MGDRGRWVLWTGAIAGCALGPRAAAKLLAVWGILFAVPAAAILRVLLPELWGLVQQRNVQGK